MIDTTPRIDALLSSFFAGESTGRPAAERVRLARAERLLRRCLETDGHRVAGPAARSLLAAERVYEPADAFARTMSAAELVDVLPRAASAPHLPPDARGARMQLRVVERLARHLVVRGLVDPATHAPALAELHDRVRTARIASGALAAPD